MPLEDVDIKEIIAFEFNENKQLKLDGLERIDPICKAIANNLYREWAVRTNSAPMKGKWQPVIIVSVHQNEPPTALSGDHYHKYKNEADKWRAYEFKLPNSNGWYIIVKFGVQQGKHAERACQSHFNDFMKQANCIGIDQSDKLRVEPRKEDKDCTIF